MDAAICPYVCGYLNILMNDGNDHISVQLQLLQELLGHMQRVLLFVLVTN